ncbi:MAG: hypothetical protein IH840_00675 [Candidatus Heimdallarchaeota archaeon]|nr:hypothetical protein [Candidatus Heimdallarchaeota archaeon]
MSLSHEDHTSVIDVDHEGNIRKYSTIPKLESIVIHYIVTVANRMRQMMNKKQKIIIVSRSRLWKTFMVNLITHVVNTFQDANVTVKKSPKEFYLQLNNLTIFYNDFMEFTQGIDYETTLVLDQQLFNNPDVVKVISNNIDKIQVIGVALKHTLANLDFDDNMDEVDIIIQNHDIASVYHMIPDLESVALFMLEIIDKISFV